MMNFDNFLSAEKDRGISTLLRGQTFDLLRIRPGSEISLRTALSGAVNSVLFGPNQMYAVYSTWENLLHALSQAAQTERLVVVSDEFPYIVAAHPPLATIFQRVWDQTLKNSQIMLILCGSYIGAYSRPGSHCSKLVMSCWLSALIKTPDQNSR